MNRIVTFKSLEKLVEETGFTLEQIQKIVLLLRELFPKDGGKE
jgi:hypothetical protein